MTSPTDPLSRMKEFQDAISRAGVRCALDPRDINPPAVLIRPPSLDYRFGRGVIAGTWVAWLYLPDAGVLDALRNGFAILEDVYTALASVGVAVMNAVPGDFQTADGGIMPGFTINWTTSR